MQGTCPQRYSLCGVYPFCLSCCITQPPPHRTSLLCASLCARSTHYDGVPSFSEIRASNLPLSLSLSLRERVARRSDLLSQQRSSTLRREAEIKPFSLGKRCHFSFFFSYFCHSRAFRHPHTTANLLFAPCEERPSFLFVCAAFWRRLSEWEIHDNAVLIAYGKSTLESGGAYELPGLLGRPLLGLCRDDEKR